jgi:hypothetical protein
VEQGMAPRMQAGQLVCSPFRLEVSQLTMPCPGSRRGIHFMLRAAVLLSLFRRILRLSTTGRPGALEACHAASWHLPRLDFHQLAGDSFQGTRALVRHPSKPGCSYTHCCLMRCLERKCACAEEAAVNSGLGK